jgi:hypothetical protein
VLEDREPLYTVLYEGRDVEYSTETESADVIGTKVLRVFLLAIHSHLY